MRKKSIPSCSFYNPFSSYHSFDDMQQKNNEKFQGSRMYECELCGKRFNSGNALGGHKTSHRRSQPLNKKQRHSHAINKDDEKHNHSCHVCNKVFQSKEALCGHIRCHKRDRKGIHPPTSSSIDLSKYLPPISYQTYKGSKRNTGVNFIDKDVARTLVQISHDNNHGDSKRLKLSCDMVNETVKEQTVKLTTGHVRVNDETVVTEEMDNSRNKEKLVPSFKVTKEKDDSGYKRLKLSSNSEDIGDIDESLDTKVEDNNASIDIEEKKNNNELKSNRVVMNFDLNELPMEDVVDE